ncbi:MAG: tryptophan synthase subunit alpha, partial [Acidobacteria bacterium]|nr:tryptophan synthase subunit alpha [Acidobacteriota bacterium]
LFTDLPPEAAKEIRSTLHAAGLGAIFLAAPTSTDERLARIDRASDGFVYYVSTTGVTGTRRELDAELVERLQAVREKLRNPVAVGFGISERKHYLALEGKCDAVVVGSAIVRAIAEGEPSSAAGRAAEVVRRILGN